MQTTIDTTLNEIYVNKWVQCYRAVDLWDDYIYRLSQDSLYPDGELVHKLITETELSGNLFTMHFDDGCLEVWTNDVFDIFDTHF